jgi:hypothetical protein
LCGKKNKSLELFAKCQLQLGFLLPRQPGMWALLVRNAVKLLNRVNLRFLSQPHLKNGSYVSKNAKVVAM